LPSQLELRDVGPPHPSLSYPCSLIRLFCPIIPILFGTVDRLGYQLTMSDSVAQQFVRNGLSGFAAMTSY
jgi:hypothetical protein